ncbi:hypothetical protein DVH24_003158 [Malus domestica]|uniref:Uncharacterized protein n=1 Tax=Malus domestica TaxID=3750 RepID=A0A498K4A6_MALDO|nr:hypothetical protein DVH24_003158 [Malus domestica]
MLEDVPPHSDWSFLLIIFVFMHLMSSLDAIYAKDGLLCRSSIFLVIDRNLRLRGSLAGVLQGLHLAFDIHKFVWWEAV